MKGAVIVITGAGAAFVRVPRRAHFEDIAAHERASPFARPRAK